MEYPAITEDDGTTLAIPFAVDVEGGEVYGPHEYWITNDFEMVHLDAETIDEAFLRVEANVGAGWKQTGIPLLEEKWTKVTLFGQDDTNDPTMQPQVTGTTALGSGSVLFLSDIPPGTARKLNLTVEPPTGASPGLVQLRVVLTTKKNTIVLAGMIQIATGIGVIPGYRNSQFRRIAFGQDLIADGTDTIIIERGAIDYDGKREVFVREEETFDQNASDGALGVGESYVAVITRASDRTLTVTKGTGAVAPTVPAYPADEVYLGQVAVPYSAGATAIVQADVDTTLAFKGEYEVVAGAGLTVSVRGGEGIAGDSYQFNTKPTIVAIVNGTNYVWRTPADAFIANVTGLEPQPYSDLLATVTAAGGVITAVDDRRQFLTAPVVVMVKETNFFDVMSTLVTPVRIGSFVLEQDADLDEVVLDLSELDGTWTADGVSIDVLYYEPGETMVGAGTSVFTSSGIDDQRPRVAWNAAFLRSTSKYVEVRRFLKGTRFAIEIVEVPAAPGPEGEITVFAQLHFRRTR